MDSITELVDTTDITIIPTMNPDGFDRGKEGECSGADHKTGRFNEGRKDIGCEGLRVKVSSDVRKNRPQPQLSNLGGREQDCGGAVCGEAGGDPAHDEAHHGRALGAVCKLP